MVTARSLLLASALLLSPPLVAVSFAQSTTTTTVKSPVGGYGTNTYKHKHHKKPIHGLKTGPGAKAGTPGLGESSGTATGN